MAVSAAGTPGTRGARLIFWLVPAVFGMVATLLYVAIPGIDPRIPTDPANPLQNPAHFWIISAAAVFALGLGVQMSEAARFRQDARIFLVSLTVLTTAAATLLHALATANVLIPGRNIGFVVAAPVGIIMAAFTSAASALELTPPQARTLMRRQGMLRALLLLFWVVFATLALPNLPPFSWLPDLEAEAVDTPLLYCLIGQAPLPQVQWPLTVLLVLAAGLYGWTGMRYAGLFRRRPSVVLLGLTAAFTLLAVTTLNLGLSRTWHLAWWQWHVLLLLAYGLLAFSAFAQFRQEGSARPLFDSVFLDETVARIRREYTGALETLVESFHRRAQDPDAAGALPVAEELAERFGLSAGQVRVLEQAAEALAHERQQIARLGALVAVGQESRVIQEEGRLLQHAVTLAAPAFARDRLQIGLIQEGALSFPPELRAGAAIAVESEGRAALLGRALRDGMPAGEGGTLVLPLMVKGRPAGVLEVRRASGGIAERDRAVLESLASQLSVALENARLYRQIDALFRQYMPASVATALLADPSQAALGGAEREITVMFGDLRGFTTLSERLSPPELVALLNRYYGAASQAVLDQGGTIDKFMGDALMALFNAPATQADHALRACRAALGMQQAIAPIAAEAPDMPRFGIGITTGPALVGNIGSEAIRNFTAIGDTVNMASRLQGRASGGQVLISAGTYALVRDHVQVQPLGALQVKGRVEPVETYLLLEVRR